MKVLITVQTYYPKKDGVQNVTEYLAEGLVKKGYEVTVITSNKNIKENQEIHNGVIIKRINLNTKGGFYFGDKKLYKNIIKEETQKCDLMINVCTQNAFTDVILKEIDSYKCKKILYLHGMFDFRFSMCDFSSMHSAINKLWKEVRWFFYYVLNGKYFRKYDCVTQLHEKNYANEFFKKMYNIDSKIIPNAAENVFFENIDKNTFEKPFEKYLIYVANYDDNKNQKLAIKEFLNSKISNDIGLVLIGSNNNKYYNKLEKYDEKLRKKLNINKEQKPIKMLYGIDRNLISSYVANAELYIMTSKREVFPISIVEAMACGVPYICTDVGIVKYFFGGIISKDNEISYWIEKVINNQKIKEQLSNLCKIFSKENFRIDAKVDFLDENIKKIVNGKKDVIS